MKRFTTADLARIALMAAILCILSPISIPLGFTPIPITLGLFAVVMAGILLGSMRGMACVLVYILLGAVGLPVFSGYAGGLPKVAGPTGGYLWGYLPLAFLTGLFAEKSAGKWHFCMLGAALGTAACYLFGTVWMGAQLSMPFRDALLAGVVPFLPLDLVKIIVAVLVCCPIRARLTRAGLLP